jgi:ketosteroid isomerase-like protein
MDDDVTQRPVPGWSRQLGLSAVGPAPASEGDPGVDRVLIMDRIHRYAWGYDERDLDGLGECFTEDATWEGWVMGTGHVGPFTGRDAIRRFMADFWPQQQDQRRHIFTNVLIDDYTGTTATAHAYLLLMSSQDAATTPVTVGPYRLDLVKDDDGVWRLAHLRGGWDSPF